MTISVKVPFAGSRPKKLYINRMIGNNSIMKIWTEENIRVFYEYYGKISDKDLAKWIGAKDYRTIEKRAKFLGLWKSKKFSDEDYKFADDNKFILTTKEISDYLGKSEECVRSYLRKKGFYKNTNNYIWNDEKINILKRDYERGDWNKLLSDLDTNNDATIHEKAYKLGLKRCFYAVTNQEEKFIIDNFYNMSAEEISQILKRPLQKIQRKISRLKLDNNYFQWSEDETNLLKKVYAKYSNHDLQRMFFPNFSEKRISTRAEFFNLKKDYDKNRFKNDDILRLLKKVYVEIGRTPIVKELKKYGLPSSATFKKYFGGYMAACILADIPINNNKIFSRGIYLSKNNDICFSASEVIISDFLYENNIIYKKEVYYKNISSDKRFKNWQLDWLLFDGTVVEFFGLKTAEYLEKMNKKIELCNINDLNLISLYDSDINKLSTVFQKYLLI